MQGSTSPASSSSKENKPTLFYLLATSLVSVFFVLSFSRRPPPSSSPSNLHLLLSSSASNSSSHSQPPPPPSIAYLLSGSSSDYNRLLRLLFSVYHPNNRYLLYLDLSAPDHLRHRLAVAVRSVPVFRAARNVDVIGRPDFANTRGSSALASTLHGAAILLRLHANWDWFINLDARDYPLLNQDDLLHVMSFLPRELNFVQHTSHIGWRESRRIKPIVVDPGLYLSSKSDIFYATQKRELPNAYRIFSGSPSVVLSRKFVEFCILGLDNLPRTLLMYYANTPSSHTNYFQTVVCNLREFNKTTVNYNMHYVSWDDPPKRVPRTLGFDDFEKMIESGAAFGTQFSSDDAVLDRIDREVLNRRPGKTVPGGWCLGEGDEPCAVWGDANILRPGSGAKRFEKAIVDLLSNVTFRSQQCISE